MNKVQLKKKSLDESDEDYMAGEDYDDEFDESEDEYCYSLAVDGTDESLREFGEEERTKKVKRVGGPRGQRSSRGRNGIVELRNKNAAYCAENGGLKGRKKGIHGGKKSVFGGELRIRTPDSSAKRKADHSNEKPRKETNVLCREEGEDNDWNDSDEEIRPDEVGGDEELTVMKKNKVTRLTAQAAQGVKRENKKRKLKNLKRTIRKKPKKECAVEESRDEGSVAQKTKRGRGNGEGMGKLNVSSGSDSDSVSGFSGYEYTISEEEREQIREAKEICKSLTTDLRSSYLKTIKGEETVPRQQKRPETKEKEEMVDRKMKVGKQVCGICLSEEGKRPVRAILNCCSHYFCFACIIEWSKVDSRCPLCKQRFETIRRTAQVVGEHGSRDVTIPVPECDQVLDKSFI